MSTLPFLTENMRALLQSLQGVVPTLGYEAYLATTGPIEVMTLYIFGFTEYGELKGGYGFGQAMQNSTLDISLKTLGHFFRFCLSQPIVVFNTDVTRTAWHQYQTTNTTLQLIACQSLPLRHL